MTRNFIRRSPTAPVSVAQKRRSVLRGGAALLLALGMSTALTALLAHDQPAAAQLAIENKDALAQAEKAQAFVRRCDVVNANKEIAGLEGTSKVLKAAHATGAVKGAEADAKLIDVLVKQLKDAVVKCPSPKNAKTTAGANGETYGFLAQDDADAAAAGIADAKRFARDCDRKGYQDNIKAIREQADRTKAEVAKGALRQLADDLEAAAAALFKHCDQPGKAETPKEPAKTEPAKTGTGTGTGTPPKPPEPPKAPADSPGHGSVPTMKFNGEVFANVVFMPQFGAGTIVNGGRHTIVDSPGTISGAGFNFGLEIPTLFNPYGTGEEPSWSINIGFARARGTSTGSVAPGTANTGFDYIAPNPASGFIFLSHGLNGQVVYVRSERDQFDAEVLHNVKWQWTFNTVVPKTNVEVSTGVGFQFRAIWDSHDVDQSIINFPTVTSHTNLDSSTYFFGPKVILRGEYEIGKFSLYASVRVAPGLAVGSGSAEQHAACPVCAASEQNVNLSRDDTFVKVAVNAGARVWVAYDITPAVSARAFFGYDYFSAATRWQLDPGNAQLKGGSTGNFRVGVGLKLRF